MLMWIWHINLLSSPVYMRVLAAACSGTLVNSLDLAGRGESCWTCGDESDPRSFRFNFRISSDTFPASSTKDLDRPVRNTYPVLRMEARNNSCSNELHSLILN